jgi:hypothetical protein
MSQFIKKEKEISEMTNDEFFDAYPQPKLKDCVYIHNRENHESVSYSYLPEKKIDSSQDKNVLPIKLKSQPIMNQINTTISLPFLERPEIEVPLSCDLPENTSNDKILYSCENIMPDIIEPKE